MLRTIKPKNARSKRALDARAPKEIEDSRTAIFVKGTKTGETLNKLMKDLMALKRPDAISFSKKNVVHPFESVESFEFWSAKNDAGLFVYGQNTKKRPNGLCFVRMYDGKVLDMVEVGVENFVPLSEFKTPKSSPGHKPTLHFASELFETNPRLMQLKSMLMTFFNGEEIKEIHLKGLEHIISISCGPTPSSPDELPKIHLRTYTTQLLASGTRIPRVELTPMGPSVDFVVRRHQDPDAELLKQAMRRPKLKKTDVESGLGKKRKNMEVDEMGDLRGRVHVGKQDLSKLQSKKMKGLREGD
ncbi:Brix domain-containing protein [Mycena floridula]|nr:Brix domain-containing protein [Mycena floridula]